MTPNGRAARRGRAERAGRGTRAGIDVERGAAGRGTRARRSSGASEVRARSARVVQQRLPPLHLRRAGALAAGGDAVVAAALVVEGGVGALVGLLDQSVREHPLDRA